MSIGEQLEALLGFRAEQKAPRDAEGLAARAEGDPGVMRRDPSEPAPGPTSDREAEALDVDWVRPVEVAVVKTITVREAKAVSWTTSRSAVDPDTVVMVAGASPERKKLHVRNTAANDVWLGPFRSVEGLRAQGYTLAPGDSVGLDHTQAVFAVAGPGLAGTVDVVMTFEAKEESSA